MKTLLIAGAILLLSSNGLFSQKALTLVEKYAPVAWLHGNEEYFPMNPEEFIQGSILKKNTWFFDPVVDHDPSFEYMAPSHNSKKYYLSVVDLDLKGNANSLEQVPSFYTNEKYGNCQMITYWFFFGYSHFGGVIGHEGDWENVTIMVKKTDREERIVASWFFSHGKATAIKRSGLSFDKGRFEVFIAKNRHGTLEKVKKEIVRSSEDDDFDGVVIFRVPEPKGKPKESPILVKSIMPDSLIKEKGSNFFQFWADDETGKGYEWDTRLSLRPLESLAWREFKGRWGNLGLLPGEGTDGPWGPRKEKNKSLNDWLLQEIDVNIKRGNKPRVCYAE